MAYFANGSEGEYLEEQCASCPIGRGRCPIYLVQMQYNYDQLRAGNEKLREAMNLLIDDQGVCQARPMIVKTVEEK